MEAMSSASPRLESSGAPSTPPWPAHKQVLGDLVETAMDGASRSTVFFPGAGSFGNEFQLLVDALQPAAWLVKYPGRYGRDFGVPAESFDGVVRACTEQIASRPAGHPVLFGHSFGAYVAYATAVR